MIEAKDAAEAAKAKVSMTYRYNEDTDEYEGAAGRFYKALIGELRDNQDKFSHVWQYAKALAPKELYSWLSGQLTAFLNGAISAKVAEIEKAYAVEIAELKRLNDAALKENSRLVGEYSRKYDQIAGGFSTLNNKLGSAIAAQNADIQESRNEIQARSNDLGMLVDRSMKQTEKYREMVQYTLFAMFGVVILLCVVTLVSYLKADSLELKDRMQSRLIEHQIEKIDSLERLIPARGQKKRTDY
jgi:uncharacterized protein YdcH (DUF465 family)